MALAVVQYVENTEVVKVTVAVTLGVPSGLPVREALGDLEEEPLEDWHADAELDTETVRDTLLEAVAERTEHALEERLGVTEFVRDGEVVRQREAVDVLQGDRVGVREVDLE